MIILISCIPVGATKSTINRLQNCMVDKLARFACSLDAPIFWVDETIYLIIFRVNDKNGTYRVCQLCQLNT